MFKRSILFFLLISAFLCKSQEVKPTDLIPQRACIVIPGIEKEQLESLKAGFEGNNDIKSAIYAYKDHNCLLVEIKDNASIKFYSDVLKLIQVNSNIQADKLFLKTPAAYEEILGKAEGDSYFIVK